MMNRDRPPADCPSPDSPVQCFTLHTPDGPHEIWDDLFQQAISFAEYQIKRLR